MESKILFVDDDPLDLEIVKEAFSECGVDTIHTVTSKKEAFNYLESLDTSQLPEVIVTDLNLGNDSGVELLEELKSVDRYKNIKIIVTSSGIVERYSTKYKELGAFDYIEKPHNFKEYVRTASEIIQLTIRPF